MSSAQFTNRRGSRSIAAAQPKTMIAWIRATNVPSASYQYVCTESGQIGVGVDPSGNLVLSTNTTDDVGSAVPQDTWLMLAWVRSGDAHTIYRNGSSEITATRSDSATTIVFGAWVHNANTSPFAGQIGPVFVYTAALSQAEIQAQYRAGRRPVRHENLTFWNPAVLGTDFGSDHSGTGGNLTMSSSPTLSTQDPGIPWSVRVPAWVPASVAGGQTVTPDLLTGTGTIHDPTINPGAAAVSPDLLAGVGTVHEPTITPGAATVAPDLLTGTGTVFEPTISSTTAITPDLLVGAGTVHEPEIVMTNVVTPDLLTGTGTVFEPNVTPGAVTITPDLLAGVGTVHEPTVVPGAAVAVPDLLVGAGTVHEPTLAHGGQTTGPDLLIGAGVIFEPTLVPGPASVSPALLVGAGAVFGPFLVQVTALQRTSGPHLVSDVPSTTTLTDREQARVVRG